MNDEHNNPKQAGRTQAFTLKPSKFGEAKRFLKFLARTADPRECFQLIHDRDRTKKGKWKFNKLNRRMRQWLDEKQAEGFGIFVAVCEMDGGGRSYENARSARVQFLDLDGTPLPDEWAIEPHCIVETSPGPPVRYHVYWLIEPTGDLDAWTDVQARLAAHYGGDPDMADRARVARLPGFWHLKGEPSLVKITEMATAVTLSTLDEFKDKHPCPQGYRKPGPRNEDGSAKAPEAGWDAGDSVPRATEYLQTAEVAVSGEHGNDRTYKTACAVRDYGVSPEKCAELMGAYYNDRCQPPWSTEELRTIVDNAYRYASGEAGSNTSAEEDFGEAGEPEEPTGKADADPATPLAMMTRGLDIVGGRARDSYLNAVSAIYRANLGLAYDKLEERIVFRAEKLPWDIEAMGPELNDHTLGQFRTYLCARYHGSKFEPSEENISKAALFLADREPFNPVLDYLDGLKWDGVARFDRLFPEYFNCVDDAYARGCSRAFMVGAVRRMRKPGCKFDTVPVLISPTGWDKSTGLKTLFFDKWFSDAEMGDLKGKDAAMLTRGVWAIEFAELSSIRRGEVETVKAFMSRAVDRLRDPFGHYVEKHPRRCVFAGTANPGGSPLLKDQTGNRRYWPMHVLKRIDVKKIARDRDQLWAEASLMEALGESNVLPRALWTVAAERQADETAEEPWKDILRTFLEERKEAAARAAAFDVREDDSLVGEELSRAWRARLGDRVHSLELYAALGIANDRLFDGHTARVRAVMESLGWKHTKNVKIGRRSGKGFLRSEG